MLFETRDAMLKWVNGRVIAEILHVSEKELEGIRCMPGINVYVCTFMQVT